MFTESVNCLFVAIFGDVRRATGALFLYMYRICGVTETVREYLYDLFLRPVIFVVGFSVREQAKLAPEFCEQLGKSGVKSQQTGEVLNNLIETGQIACEAFTLLSHVSRCH